MCHASHDVGMLLGYRNDEGTSVESTGTGEPAQPPKQRRQKQQPAQPATWWAAALILLVILGSSFLGPLSADPRFDLVLPDREGPSQPAPAASPAASPMAQPVQEPESDQRLAYLAIAIIAVLATVAAVTTVRFLRRLKPSNHNRKLPLEGRDAAYLDLPEDAPSDIGRLFENAKGHLNARQDSSDAILRCWLELEAATELAGLPRRPAETPSEFAAAVLRRFQAPEVDTDKLLSLYERVRFATSAQRRAVSTEDLAQARQALQRVEDAVSGYLEQRGAHAAG